MTKERRNLPPKEVEVQRGGKQARVMQTMSSSEGAIINRRGDQQTKVPTWTPSLVLDKAPFPRDASIKDFQQSKAEYVANAVEQALLLPTDIANLRSMRKYEVFLNLKRDLAMVSPLTPISPFSSPFFFYKCISFFDRLFKLPLGQRIW